MATHPRILAWEIPWKEEPGRLQSMGSQRVCGDTTELTCTLRHYNTTELTCTLRHYNKDKF